MNLFFRSVLQVDNKESIVELVYNKETGTFGYVCLLDYLGNGNLAKFITSTDIFLSRTTFFMFSLSFFFVDLRLVRKLQLTTSNSMTVACSLTVSEGFRVSSFPGD